MECCYALDCGENEVTPVLVACQRERCFEEPPLCLPCLPRCSRGQVVYCCGVPPSKRDLHEEKENSRSKAQSPPPCRPCPASPSCAKCCPPCKPVKTKYVIPCYRYEDGRIRNQPTLLMKRACEVAVGVRPRKTPFVCSTYCRDPQEEVSKYHSQDEQGNCCYHFEKKHTSSTDRSHGRSCRPDPCQSWPQCQYVDTDSVRARPINPHSGCYYYCCS